MTGKEIVELIEKWLTKHNVHPDDLDMLFANELLEKMEQDN